MTSHYAMNTLMGGKLRLGWIKPTHILKKVDSVVAYAHKFTSEIKHAGEEPGEQRGGEVVARLPLTSHYLVELEIT